MRVVRGSFATFVVALILLGAQASQALHELVVPHETCLVHGEVVEGGAHADPADAPTSGAATAQARLLAAAGGNLHADDRCLGTVGDSDAVTSDAAALGHDLPVGAALPAPTTTQEGRRS